MVFTPDGRVLATLSVDNQVRLWNITDGTLLRKLGNSSRTTAHGMAFTADGSILMIGLWHTIQWWRIEDGMLLQTLEIGTDMQNIAFSPDRAILATGFSGGALELWDINKDLLLHKLKGHTYSVTSVAFSPDGKVLASGSADETVRLWRVSDGKLLYTLRGHTQSVGSLAFSPEGTVLASAGGDRTVRLWNVQEGNTLHILEGHTGNIFMPGYINTLSFSPGGTIVASGGGDRTVRLWRISDGRLLHIIRHSRPVWDIAFSPDGEFLATAEMRGPVHVFNVQHWNLGSK